MAHFVRHIVAAAFAKISLHGGTPAGYGVLNHVTPHPNGETRIRTQLAAAICEFVAAQSPGTSSDREVIEVQVFVLILWRYHNTQGAWDKMRPFVGSYCRGEITILEFQHCIRDMYGTNTSKSYLFSLGDGQRCSGGAGSWRKAAVAEIPGWRGAATSIASTLIHPATTPESFFEVFLKRLLRQIRLFDIGYWGKFLWGDLRNIRPDVVDLEQFTIVGVGCFKEIRHWGIALKKNQILRQQQGRKVLSEVKECLDILIEQKHVNGLNMAVQRGGLSMLSVYDIQDQFCERKRARCGLPPRLASVRAPLENPSLEKLARHR